MNYTKQQRRNLHASFKAAEPHLDSHTFLCWALDAAHGREEITSEQWSLAKELIAKRIHPEGTVRYWLEESAGVPKAELKTEPVRAYRKRWLESLIKEFSE